MPLISTPIPNLIGGVSQQPPSIRNINEAEVIENAVPSPVEGLIKRPPTEFIAAIHSEAGVNTLREPNKADEPFFHLIERDANEKYILSILKDGTVDIFDLSGQRKTLYKTLSAGGTTYFSGLGTADYNERVALTVADVTFILNKRDIPALSGTLSTYGIAGFNVNRNALVWIRQTNTGRSLKVSVTVGATTYTETHTTSGSTNLGTNHAAVALAGDLAANAPLTATTAKDSVIWIKANADMTVTIDDDFGGEGTTLIIDSVERFEDLPPCAPNGYMVRVAGTPESGYDDYWVKFVTFGAVTFGQGLWEETVAPGIKYQINAATMPKILIRQSDGSFMLKDANGTTPTTGDGLPAGSAATLYNDYDWNDRLVGDADTNPDPSFIGTKINDMVYYQSRLGFMAGENLVFSETSEFFNFWRTTVLDLLDTDPIDVASSASKVGVITAAIQFNRDLILFTPTNQMVMRSGDVFSPKNVAILNTGDFENQSNLVAPIPSANSIFFTYSNGGYSGVRELVPQPNIDGSYLANNLTDNVSRYIVGTPRHMAATAHDNITVLISNDQLYCYRYFNSDNQRVQSAWFKFTFADSSGTNGSFCKPLWCTFVDSDLYVVMMRTGSTTTKGYLTIEKIRMGSGLNDLSVSGKDWLTHLDARKYYPANSGIYNAATNTTEYTLPAPFSYLTGKLQVMTKDGYLAKIVGGNIYNSPNPGNAGKIKVEGNYTTSSANPKDVWIGIPYTMTYEFSTQYLRTASRTGSPVSVIDGRYQLKYITLQFAETGFFEVFSGVKNETLYSYPFTGEVTGSTLLGALNITTGTFRAPIYGKNERQVIKVTNSSPLPSKFLSASIEAEYTDSRSDGA